jgi:hypothetical protein
MNQQVDPANQMTTIKTGKLAHRRIRPGCPA